MLRWGYFYQQCVRGTGTYKVLRSPMLQLQLLSEKRKKNKLVTHLVTRISAQFFFPLLSFQREAATEDDFGDSSNLRSLFFCTFRSVSLFSPQLCSLIWSFPDLNLYSSPEASFNTAPMIQAYFGWGHLCLLGLIIAKSSRPLTPSMSSPSSTDGISPPDVLMKPWRCFFGHRSASWINFYI